MKKLLYTINLVQVQRIACLVILFMAITNLAHAGGPIDDPGGDPDSAPIDGGLSLLIAGGVGYGVKKLRKKKVSND